MSQQTMEAAAGAPGVDGPGAGVAAMDQPRFDDDDLGDEGPPESFKSVDELTMAGVNASDVEKLRKGGYTSCSLVASASRRELESIKGISADRALMIREKAKQVDPGAGVLFASGLEVAKRRKIAYKISSGSTALDQLLGGGIELGTVTEIFGDSGTGKTQLCLSLCVHTQCQPEDGGAAGCVLYIDTDGTFRTERVIEIAEAMSMDPEQVLANLQSVHVSSFDQQCEAIRVAAGLLASPENGEYRLVVVDSVMGHLRAEYTGRSELSERQQLLQAHLRELKRVAAAFKVSVVVTNQVMAVPDSFALGPPMMKGCGGPCMAHNTVTRIQLKKGRGQQKKAVLAHSPFMPPGEVVVEISPAGIIDATV